MLPAPLLCGLSKFSGSAPSPDALALGSLAPSSWPAPGGGSAACRLGVCAAGLAACSALGGKSCPVGFGVESPISCSGWEGTELASACSEASEALLRSLASSVGLLPGSLGAGAGLSGGWEAAFAGSPGPGFSSSEAPADL